MNSAVVVKAEYRLIGVEEFTDFDIIPYSGSISESWEKSFSGIVAKVSVDFKKENWSASDNITMKLLLNRKAQFQITDSNGTVSLVGNNENPARLLFKSLVHGSVSGFNGFDCSISWLSPLGCAKS